MKVCYRIFIILSKKMEQTK